MGIRTYGLSGSGMDIDQMVKDMMKAQQARYDKVQQQKTQTEWKKSDYNTIYTLVNDFRNNTLSNFRLQSTLSPKQVTSSNDAIVTATANGAAANIEHSLIVNQLATGVKLTSNGNITTGSSKNSLKEQMGLSNGKLDFTINGKAVSIDVNDSTTINNVVNQINNAGAGVKATYDSELDRFFLYSNDTGAKAQVNFTGSSDAGLDFLFNKLKLGSYDADINQIGLIGKSKVDGTETAGGPGNLKLTVNGTEHAIDILDGDTINDVLGKLNAALGSNGKAEINAEGRVVVKSIGVDTMVSLDGADEAGKAFLTDTLGLTSILQHGQDARFSLDGVELSKSSNSFTVSGVTYSLKATSATAPNGSPIATTVFVKADNDKAIATVKSFIEDYNALIDVINKETREERYRDFTPLSDAQKAEMKESEITAWEAKAKSGMLKRDSILTSMLSSMRLNFVSSIQGLTGDYISASSLGLNTSSYIDDNGNISSAVSNGGKISLNAAAEQELRKALEEDPDVVYKIFGSPGETTETKGVANRLYDQLNEVLNKLKTESGTGSGTDTSSTLAKQLTDYDKRLSALNRQLEMVQQRYYKQFDAMELAIQRLNQQSSWLTQQFSSGNS